MDAFLTVMLFTMMVVESPASFHPVTITANQRLAIDAFQSSLVNLSSGEVEEIVYNRTTPVIELTEDQEQKLLAEYPAYFRVADSRALPPSQKRKRRSRPFARVCPSETVRSAVTVAFDKNGKPVLVPHLIRFHLYQEVQEKLCAADKCNPGFQCRCRNKIITTKAVVTYIKGHDHKFYTTELKLRSCTAIEL
ncbi:uncharacterized protein LOC117106290 [Anneissia japonica]|uniref:uncharacterized protein LOC117106290 n=1 Tax=Anneissia japonica TaxID=1529436 RepID=UPI0014256E08|nr:uncharacterized protein LOC117106290 [Anneissia japonica]XP_033103538.1 uncharacterized protein LOC117106290 [Anneissia japonica]